MITNSRVPITTFDLTERAIALMLCGSGVIEADAIATDQFTLPDHFRHRPTQPFPHSDTPLYSNGEILVAKEVNPAKTPENNWQQARYSAPCAEYSCVPDSAGWIAYRARHSPTCTHRRA
jgi:hypothetical protein